MIIAWFSCGCTSAVACKIALNEYDNVKIYYCDTGGEHEDNVRFLNACQEWYKQEIITIKNDLFTDHFGCLEQKGWGAMGASCTLELKKKMRWKIEDKYSDYQAQIFGFDLSEKVRAKRFLEQYPASKAIFPLIERGLTKQECLAIVKSAGIDLPAMYRLGYHNNNCIGCLKGGLGYWNKIRVDFPEAFHRMSEIERKRGFASHKDKDGTPIFLDELDPDRGNFATEILPECGLFCEIEMIDILN